MKQNFFDQLDGGWGEIIADTYKDAETTTLDYDIDEEGKKYISFGQRKKKLKDYVIVPEGVLYIDYGAFSKCKIKKVILPKSLKFISNKAFQYCDTLEFVEFNEGLEFIGFLAFYGCNNLKRVDFPQTLINIKPYAFEHAGLEGEITIPESVKKIGTRAFSGCNKLTKIYVKEDNVKNWHEAWNAECPAKIIYY